jgi:hypothetical protein
MLSYRQNIYSQNGEDGVLEHILNNIETNNTCCEFGAWDGKHFSNTFRLVKEKNYKALYIEGDPEKYKDLLETCNEYSNIVPVCEYVNNNLDEIFENANFQFDIDVLSIDIDSTDYEVWKNIKKVNPKVVIIEVDNSIPEWVDIPIYPTHETGGANSIILKQLGIEKGYTYMCTTGNLFFVRNDLVGNLKPDLRCLPYWLKNEHRAIIQNLYERAPYWYQPLQDEDDDMTKYIKKHIEPQYHDSFCRVIQNYVQGFKMGTCYNERGSD